VIAGTRGFVAFGMNTMEVVENQYKRAPVIVGKGLQFLFDSPYNALAIHCMLLHLYQLNSCYNAELFCSNLGMPVPQGFGRHDTEPVQSGR
jgi:hypothetical protein